MALIERFKPQELADELDVSIHTLSTWRSRKQGPRYVHIAGRVYYLKADVEAWIAEQIAA